MHLQYLLFMRWLLKMFKNKKILITGAGSLGSALTKYILKHDPEVIRVLDNHESSLYNLETELSHFS